LLELPQLQVEARLSSPPVAIGGQGPERYEIGSRGRSCGLGLIKTSCPDPRSLAFFLISSHRHLLHVLASPHRLRLSFPPAAPSGHSPTQGTILSTSTSRNPEGLCGGPLTFPTSTPPHLRAPLHTEESQSCDPSCGIPLHRTPVPPTVRQRCT
jgi:hypothetical protein